MRKLKYCANCRRRLTADQYRYCSPACQTEFSEYRRGIHLFPRYRRRQIMPEAQYRAALQAQREYEAGL